MLMTASPSKRRTASTISSRAQVTPDPAPRIAQKPVTCGGAYRRTGKDAYRGRNLDLRGFDQSQSRYRLRHETMAQDVHALAVSWGSNDQGTVTISD